MGRTDGWTTGVVSETWHVLSSRGEKRIGENMSMLVKFQQLFVNISQSSWHFCKPCQFFFAKLPAVSAPHLVPLMERFPVVLSSEGWASAAAQATAFDHHNYQTWVQIQWSAPCRSGPGLHFWTDSSLTDFRRIATESQKTSSI